MWYNVGSLLFNRLTNFYEGGNGGGTVAEWS